MTRRTRNRKTLVVAVLAAAGLAGGGVALAADGDEAPRDTVRFVVEEGAANPGTDDSGTGTRTREDCPDKNPDKNGGATTPSVDPSNPAAAL